MEDYKQKYEDALENFKKIKAANKDNKELVDFIEYNYPELKESEDERIRKEIISYLRVQDDVTEGRDSDFKKWIAWLEKQGEQKTVSKTEPIVEGLTTEFQKQVSNLIASAMDKEHEYTKGYIEWVAQSLLGYAKNEQTSTDKVEPKFKVGDWILIDNPCKIINIDNYGNYLVRYWDSDTIDKLHTLSKKFCESYFHLWTIQDAKDGDVLSFNDGHRNDCIELIKSIIGKKIEFGFCLTNGNDYEVFDGITPYTNFASREDATPATKEQRDLLFQKMKEAGYEWNFEKKELKKIEQNPAWSEEDEKQARQIERIVHDNGCAHKLQKQIADWLKSLKERYAWKPSDEQIEAVRIAAEVGTANNSWAMDILKIMYQDLKKLKGE